MKLGDMLEIFFPAVKHEAIYVNLPDETKMTEVEAGGRESSGNEIGPETETEEKDYGADIGKAGSDHQMSGGKRNFDQQL